MRVSQAKNCFALTANILPEPRLPSPGRVVAKPQIPLVTITPGM